MDHMRQIRGPMTKWPIQTQKGPPGFGVKTAYLPFFIAKQLVSRAHTRIS